MSPVTFLIQVFSDQGIVGAGYKINTYLAGTTTPQATYTDSTLVTPNANPIVLTTAGRLPAAVWVPAGTSLKIVITDANNVVIANGTIDNIPGINDTSSTLSEWVSGTSPTYISGTSFSLVGNQTTIYHIGRRVQMTMTAGVVTGRIKTSSFGSGITTLTIDVDSGSIDSGLSAVNYALLTETYPSTPYDGILQPITGNVTLVSSDFSFNSPISNITAAAVVTLPAASAVSSGRKRIFSASTSGSVSIAPIGTDNIGSSNSSLNVLPYTSVELASDGVSKWLIVRNPGINQVSQPQGRLTLQTGVPVMVTTQSAKTTVYYTPYVGQLVPIYDGLVFTMTDILAELSQLTTDATKSPAAVANNSNYDIFVWNDAGTIRATRGPAWTNTTTIGTGAGTSERVMVKGILLNANAITNGPGAQRGTYVGTISSNGSAQIDWIFGATATNGTAGVFNVWNMYNRVPVSSMVGDTTNSWSYTSATVRAANGSNTMRHTFVRGLDEDSIYSQYQGSSLASSPGVTTTTAAGVGLDVTNAFSGSSGITNFAISATGRATNIGSYVGAPGLGLHFVQALESGDTGGVFYGDNGGTIYQNGLIITLRS